MTLPVNPFLPANPWANTATYPTGTGKPWAGQPTKIVPAYTFFTPEPPAAPSAPEFNALQNQRDNSLAWLSARVGAYFLLTRGEVAATTNGGAGNGWGANAAYVTTIPGTGTGTVEQFSIGSLLVNDLIEVELMASVNYSGSTAGLAKLRLEASQPGDTSSTALANSEQQMNLAAGGVLPLSTLGTWMITGGTGVLIYVNGFVATTGPTNDWFLAGGILRYRVWRSAA